MVRFGLRFQVRWVLWSMMLLSLFPARVLAENSATVFIYHRFGDDRFPSTNIPLDQFQRQLEWLRQEKRPVLALGEIVRRLEAGETLPQGCVALTVDDAFRSFASGAMPLLRRFGFPVTLFVHTAGVGTPDYLGWEELQALAREGVEIGNHSSTHGYLLERRPEESRADWLLRVREDIVAAQVELSARLGQVPQLFAYPYGEFSPALISLVRELGFLAAAGQQSGVVGDASDRFALPRFPMGGEYGTLTEFQDKARLRALPVRVLEPGSPVLPTGGNPPTLVVEIAGEGVDFDRMKCFVQGENACRVSPDPLRPGRFTVRADRPLTGRRNKYTLTAPGTRSGWYWFSQPWFRPGSAGSDGY